jgi:phenylalanyl-tRNA synthetase beta subunit
VTHYSDVAEEIARFYGYDVIESTVFKAPPPKAVLTPSSRLSAASALCAAVWASTKF